jgi:hypothetical protein
MNLKKIRMKTLQQLQAMSFEDVETALWQILRFHHGQIFLQIIVTPHYGVLLYVVILEVNEHKYKFKYTWQGRQLKKRYIKAILTLQEIFTENLYKYQGVPMPILKLKK